MRSSELSTYRVSRRSRVRARPLLAPRPVDTNIPEDIEGGHSGPTSSCHQDLRSRSRGGTGRRGDYAAFRRGRGGIRAGRLLGPRGEDPSRLRRSGGIGPPDFRRPKPAASWEHWTGASADVDSGTTRRAGGGPGVGSVPGHDGQRPRPHSPPGPRAVPRRSLIVPLIGQWPGNDRSGGLAGSAGRFRGVPVPGRAGRTGSLGPRQAGRPRLAGRCVRLHYAQLRACGWRATAAEETTR
jgi:hypothetical protein